MSFFHFFLTGCVGWNIVLLISSEKSGTFSFFFIFFSLFLTIFRKTTFWPTYPHLTSPHVIFSFFSDRMCWVEYNFTHFKREIGNHFIFIHFFPLFLHVFQKKLFSAHLPPFNAPHVIFHFFLTGCVEWNIFLLISSEKSGTFSFFFIFLSSFWPIFRKTTF